MGELFIIIILIIFNGILAMSEIALISVRKSSLTNDIKNGSISAKTALKLANEPNKFLSTVQIGITVIGIITGIYSGSVLADDLSDLFVQSGLISAKYSHTIAQTLIVIIVTYFTIIFGELVPKRIGMSMAEKAAKVVARPMYMLSVISSPFVWILSKSTSSIFNLLNFSDNTSKVTEAEIKHLIEEGTKDGEVQEVEQDIVDRVFLLGDMKVNSLMTHRSEVVSLDINMSNQQIKQTIEDNMFDIYPVVRGTLEEVEGMISLKDLVFKIDKDDFDIPQILTPATYFHENMSVYKVLERMKDECISQALVCDEFGSCQGIITLQDILRGLVGAVENTNEEPDIIKRTGDQGGWLIDGQCPFYTFLSYFDREDLNQYSNTYITLGGLILELMEHIPQSGECVEWNEFKFEIVDMDSARIDKILVTYKE